MATEAHPIADLFTRHGRDMVRRAQRMLRSEADAQDAVQEVMLSLLRAPHVLAAVERIGAWLLTLVRRRCVDIIRRDRLREKKEAEVGPEGLFEGGDPSESMVRGEVCEAVARAVDGLPAALRSAFVENALEMKPFRQTSEETGVPMGTLMARKKRAVELIREQLRRQGLIA